MGKIIGIDLDASLLCFRARRNKARGIENAEGDRTLYLS